MNAVFHKIIGYFHLRYAVVLLPLCGFAVYDSAFSSFSSILAVLRNTYPDIPIAAIQMVLSMPPFVSVPTTLVAGIIASYVRKKTIAVFSLAVIFAGGMIPVLFPRPNVYALFACGALVGVGQGLLHPLANAIIMQTWTRPDDCSRALGFKQAVNFIGEAAVALFVGYLALSHWENAFLIYLGVLPVLLLTVIFVPKGELDKPLVSRKLKGKAIGQLFDTKFIYLLGLFFFAMMFMFGFDQNIAMLADERNLGNAADVSRITAMNSVTAFLVALAYGKISKLLGKAKLAIGLSLISIGFFFVAFGSSYETVFFGGVLYGIGRGIHVINTIYCVSMVVDKRFSTIALSFTLSVVSLGASVSPLVVRSIEQALFASQTASAAMIVAGCGIAVLAMGEGVICLCARGSR